MKHAAIFLLKTTNINENKMPNPIDNDADQNNNILNLLIFLDPNARLPAVKKPTHNADGKAWLTECNCVKTAKTLPIALFILGSLF